VPVTRTLSYGLTFAIQPDTPADVWRFMIGDCLRWVTERAEREGAAIVRGTATIHQDSPPGVCPIDGPFTVQVDRL
jgi:hypothetical protein